MGKIINAYDGSKRNVVTFDGDGDEKILRNGTFTGNEDQQL